MLILFLSLGLEIFSYNLFLNKALWVFKSKLVKNKNK
jgi:hypothetical protein